MSIDVSALLAGALAALAPPTVRTGARRVTTGDESALLPAERAAISAAVARRRREFASGRALLRELIGRDVPIPVGTNRAPVLPRDVRGSLAHDGELVVAAVSFDVRVRALGIDLEPVGPLEPEVAELIVRDDEADLDPRLAFTLKEAAYKAWSSLGGRMLEHRDVRLHIAESTYRAVVLPERRVLTGRYAPVTGHWIALVADGRDGPLDPECRPAG